MTRARGPYPTRPSGTTCAKGVGTKIGPSGNNGDQARCRALHFEFDRAGALHLEVELESADDALQSDTPLPRRALVLVLTNIFSRVSPLRPLGTLPARTTLVRCTLVHFGAVVADAPSPLSTPRSAAGQAQLRLGKPLRMYVCR